MSGESVMSPVAFGLLKAEVARCAYENHAQCSVLCRQAASSCSDEQLYELTCMIVKLVERDNAAKGGLLDTRA